MKPTGPRDRRKYLQGRCLIRPSSRAQTTTRAGTRTRLTGQIKRIYDLMADGKWRTLKQIEDATGDPPASISAQLRNLRKESFGSHVIEREHLGDGLYAYRLVE